MLLFLDHILYRKAQYAMKFGTERGNNPTMNRASDGLLSSAHLVMHSRSIHDFHDLRDIQMSAKG